MVEHEQKELPKSFWDRLELIYSKDDLEIIKKGFNIEKKKTTFRINTIKAKEEEILKILKENNLEVSKVSYLNHAYILTKGEEKILWDLPIVTQGKIYFQQIASQIPATLFKFNYGDKVLDVTAAPGSKTSQMSALMENSGEIIANELNDIRRQKLEFTLKRQGAQNVKIIKGDAQKLKENLYDYYNIESKGYFNKILFDAPCSSEGRINLNNEKSFGYWHEHIFKKNYMLSKSILMTVIPMLKTGGELVFSTCTLAPEENEAIVHFILCNYPELQMEDISIDSDNIRPGIASFGKQIYKKEVSKSIRLLPTEETEGFFIAKFKKMA